MGLNFWGEGWEAWEGTDEENAVCVLQRTGSESEVAQESSPGEREVGAAGLSPGSKEPKSQKGAWTRVFKFKQRQSKRS